MGSFKIVTYWENPWQSKHCKPLLSPQEGQNRWWRCDFCLSSSFFLVHRCKERFSLQIHPFFSQLLPNICFRRLSWMSYPQKLFLFFPSYVNFYQSTNFIIVLGLSIFSNPCTWNFSSILKSCPYQKRCSQFPLIIWFYLLIALFIYLFILE